MGHATGYSRHFLPCKMMKHVDRYKCPFQLGYSLSLYDWGLTLGLTREGARKAMDQPLEGERKREMGN